MEKLVSSWYNLRPLPESYIFPPEKRPGKLATAPLSKNIPVIDLGGHDRTSIVQQILEASQEFGFFQVINHGISESLLGDTMRVTKEVFELPPEDKARIFSDAGTKPCRLFTSSGKYDTEDIHLWRDLLQHPCHPLEKWIPFWPENPVNYREHVGKCSTEARKLALNILELISEGLGIGNDHFNEFCQQNQCAANYYPPCSDPSLTLGIPKHSDPNLITILHQGDVNGLQVLKDGEWIGVEPLSQALVVNMGYQLQIISNGKLKSVEHRAVTNSRTARTSIGFFIGPSPDCYIEPAEALITASNPQLYRGFQFKDFFASYLKLEGESDALIESYKLK